MDCNLCGVRLQLIPVGLQLVKGVIAGMNLWTVLLGRRLAPRPVYQFVTEYRTVMGPPDLVLYSPAGLVLRLKRDFWIAAGLQ